MAGVDQEQDRPPARCWACGALDSLDTCYEGRAEVSCIRCGATDDVAFDDDWATVEGS